MLTNVLRVASVVTTSTVLVATLLGDTVFLKNGSVIDGKVGYRTEEYVQLEIGKVGTMRIPATDILRIETNRRTGEEGHKASDGKRSTDSGSKKKESPGKDEVAGEEAPPGKETGAEDSKKEPPAEAAISKEEVMKVLAGKEEVDPKEEKRIERFVEDLKRQKATYRVRAERHLKAIGKPTIPYLLPLSTDSQDLTRIAVMRLFHAFGDERVIEVCIDTLKDENEYVRSYANKTLIRVTGEDFGFSAKASAQSRERSRRKWAEWWRQEVKSLVEQLRANPR